MSTISIVRIIDRELFAFAHVLRLVYEPGTSLSLQLLASHLFYRALLTVPSLIRAWLLDCTDRQLSASVVSYTSQHFSPVLIRTELAHVKSPEAAAELTDDNMTIKDTKKVGVLDDRWRAWVLGVQQIIWSQVRNSPVSRCPIHAPSERAHRGWSKSLQEKCHSSLRRSSRMCNLLLVRI